MTAGTNHAETVSARRCIGAFEPCASSTSRDDLRERRVAPTAVARITNDPVPLTVDPMTVSPVRLRGWERPRR